MPVENNIVGLKYFIYLISQNEIIPYIDTDIRKIIWDYASSPCLILHLNNGIIMRLNIHI
jgi:hypothetical protein